MRNIVFIVIMLFYLAANLYVGFRIYTLLPANSFLRIAAIAIVALGMLGIPLYFMLEAQLPDIIAGFLYRFSTAWLIAFAYLFLIFLLIDLGKLINLIFHFADKNVVYSLFRHNWITSVVILGGVSVLLLAGNINYHHKKRFHIPVKTDKLAADAKPLRIVAVSDLHLGYNISTKELRKWIEMINAEKPDLVVIGGDLIDNNIRSIVKANLDKELQKIDAPMGVYACPGNHEFISGMRESESFFKKAGIPLLRDSVVNLESVTIIGRDDYTNRNRKSLDELAQQGDLNNFTIVLDHQPQNLNDAEKAKVDFQFSGHTHHGQIFPFSLVTDAIYELSHGYKKKGNTHFFVSSGLGIWGGKFRIGTNSDYLVLDVAR